MSSRVDAVWDAVDEVGEGYTFLDFIRKYKLDKAGFKQRANDYFIVCPFHGDVNPSLSVDESARRFHCFGCNAGYRYRDFVYKYRHDVLGEHITMAGLAQEILNNDPNIRNRVGFSNVKETNVVRAVGFRPKFKMQQPTLSYLDVLKKCKNDDEKLFAISMAQRGVPAARIVEELKEVGQTTTKQYSLEELNE